MKRQFSFFLISVSLFGSMNVSILHAQIIMAWGEYGVDTLNLNLVRTAGLREIDLIEQDSGRPEYKTFERFSMSGDSIWDYSHYQNRFDSGSRKMLFDPTNRLLFESDFQKNNFMFQGRQSYYCSYDSLGRMIKKSELSSVDNRLTTDILSYNSRGDTVVTSNYDQDGQLFQIDTNIYDRYGNQLLWRQKHVGIPEWSESEIGHNLYDSRGRLIARGSMPSIKPTPISYPFMEKKEYVDTPGIENEWDYRWADTSWSKIPDEHSRMDSITLERTTEYFDMTGALIGSKVEEYQSLRHPLHVRYEKPKLHFVRTEEWTYGLHGERTSYTMRHDDRVISSEIFSYIYSK
jgi:hypothetical protein